MRHLSAIAIVLLVAGCNATEPEPVVVLAADKPPYFVVDENKTGPLTLDELDIHLPPEVARHWGDDKQACFFHAVASRAAEAGDPELLEPDEFAYWDGRVDAQQWQQFSSHMRRVLLAQAVLSWAALDC